MQKAPSLSEQISGLCSSELILFRHFLEQIIGHTPRTFFMPLNRDYFGSLIYASPDE